MIVVEGFDASGKSTLAVKIGKRLTWPIVHTGGPTKGEDDVLRCLTRSRHRMTLHNVQDRITHVSEACYGMLRSPKSAALAIQSLRDFHDGVTVIYCRPPTEFMLEALKNQHVDEEWDTPKHMAMVLENARTIIAIYDTIMAVVGHRTGLYQYDRTVSGADEQIVEIMSRRFKP